MNRRPGSLKLLAAALAVVSAPAQADTPVGVAATAAAAAVPPVISKPRPAGPAAPGDVQTLPPAQFDPSLSIAGQDLKAKEVDTRLNVAVLVNGRGPYRFIVDSGADSSAVGLRIAHDLELPLGRPVLLNGMTSRDIVDRVKIDQLTIGSSTIPNLELPALREGDLGGDGLVGIDALSEQRLMMDFEAREVRIEDARIPMKGLPGEIVIVARRSRGQLILTAVTAGNLKLDAVVDTGSEVTIGNTALRDKLLRHGAKFTKTIAIGVTGQSFPLEMAVISLLRLGPVTLEDVPIAFADVPPFAVFGLSNEPALLLGTDLLNTFRRVSLDFKARKIRFQLRHCGSEGVTISTSSDFWSTRLSSTNGLDVCGR